MIELNVDEIEKYGITEQPTEYNSEEQLIKWLKYDLLQQAKSKIENKDKKIITITNEEEKNYTLDFNKTKNNSDKKVYINFYLEFDNIIHKIISNNCRDINFPISSNNIIFNKGLEISNFIFNREVVIRYCHFYEKLTIKSSKFDNNLDFYNAIFYCTLNLDYNTFNRINFDVLSFKKEVKFTNINFNDVVYFYDYYDTKRIEYIQFHENLIFKNVKINKNLIFKNIKFSSLTFDNIVFLNNNSSIDIYNINEKIIILNFNNTLVYNSNQINFQKINIYELNLKGLVIKENFLTSSWDVDKCITSDTARILKKNSYLEYNIIKAIKYQAEETRLHKEELKEQFKENKNLKTFGDILSIELSSLYSDNGQNWIKAFICTILFPSVFFTLSYNIYNIPIFIFVLISFLFIPLCDNTKITKYIFISMFTYLILFIPIQNYIFSILIDIDNKSFIKELLSYITPTNFNQIILDKTNESYIYKDNIIIRAISYFLGKIAFWYGSVQTVQAFRKFAKGA